MPAPPLPEQQLGYFRWFQCFRVGVAVAFRTGGASASQSSDEPEQVRGSSWITRLGSGAGPRRAAPGRAGPRQAAQGRAGPVRLVPGLGGA